MDLRTSSNALSTILYRRFDDTLTGAATERFRTSSPDTHRAGMPACRCLPTASRPGSLSCPW